MSWSHTETFTGAASRGVGGGYPPRGIYQFTTVKSEYLPGKKNPDERYMKLYHRIDACYAFNAGKVADALAESFVSDTTWVGQEIRNSVFFKHPSRSDGVNEGRERDLKAAFIAHGAPKAQVDPSTGQRQVSGSDFDNKPGYLLYDPPPQGAPRDVYPETRYLDANTFNKIQAGTQKVNWPQDRKGSAGAQNTAKQQAQAAMGTPGAAPTVPGAPGPAPVAAPVAPTVPSNGVDPSTVAAAVVPAPPGAASVASQSW